MTCKTGQMSVHETVYSAIRASIPRLSNHWAVDDTWHVCSMHPGNNLLETEF